MYSVPSSDSMRADAAIPVALGALDGGVNDVVHERRLARPAHAGDAGEHASGMSTSMSLRLCSDRAA